ncbi:MAG: hypothetical protein ACPGXK_08180 [Phycisphaerae bacterium]
MAKQLVGPFERHVEKLVLGVVGLALLAVIALFLATSPNKIDIDGEMVGPGQIGNKVYDKAEEIRGRISRAKPDEEAMAFDPLYNTFEEEITSISKAEVKTVLPAVVRFSPPVPIIDKAGKTTQDRTLVEVIPFEPPVLTNGRSKFIFEDEDENERLIESNWATVSATFSVRGQTEKQQLEYGPKRSEVVFFPAELQRRKLRNDGTWSDDDWQQVDSWPTEVGFGSVPTVQLVRNEDQEWEAPREVFKSVQNFFEKLRDPVVQNNIIRPLMPDVFLGDQWQIPIVTVKRDILMQDMWYLYYGQDDVPEQPENRYEEVERSSDDAAGEPEVSASELIEESKRYLREARETCVAQAAIKAYNRALDAERLPDASRLDKANAANLKREANNVQDDIERGLCKPKGGGGPVQTKAKEPPPVQQFWAHDAKPSSIEPGGTYQYRIRPRIFNRLAGQPTLFSDAKFAETIILNGPWSDPTAPVTFARDKFYYLTGSDNRRNDISLEMYRWFDGEWVKTNGKFTVGQRLFERDRVFVPNPLNPDEIDNPRVPFDMEGIVVDIDHTRSQRIRKQDRRGNVTFESASEDCAVVILGEDGRLHERFVSTDKVDPGRSFNKGRIFKKPAGTK